jgi:hypothetical protein
VRAGQLSGVVKQRNSIPGVALDPDALAFPGLILLLAGWAVVVIVEELKLGASRVGRDERRKADLRQRAPIEKRAANQLRKQLLRELRIQEAVRKDLQADRGTGDEQAGLLQQVERAEQATRDELARVEMLLGRGR